MSDERPDHQDQRYPVNTIYATIQGEGAFTGTPVVLVRLQGCGVRCPWCDTKETWDLKQDDKLPTIDDVLTKGAPTSWTWMNGREIADYVTTHHPSLDTVLITGGEPGHYICAPLVAHLTDRGLWVSGETSGCALGVMGADWKWLCVSPKIGNPGGLPVQFSIIEMADEIKYPIGKESDVDDLRHFLREYDVQGDIVISLQPISENKKATALCVKTALEEGWNLSIQIHKFLGLP